MVTTESPVKAQPRLKQRYRNEISDALHKEFNYGNVMQIPTRRPRSSSTWASARRPGTPS